MYHVEMYARVRRACMVEGMSVREASRVFGVKLLLSSDYVPLIEKRKCHLG